MIDPIRITELAESWARTLSGNALTSLRANASREHRDRRLLVAPKRIFFRAYSAQILSFGCQLAQTLCVNLRGIALVDIRAQLTALQAKVIGRLLDPERIA